MSGIHVLMLVSIGLLVVFQVYWVVRILWRLPLAHGPGFFLNVQVPSEFYEGPGVQWLHRYHAALLGMLGIQGIILVYLVLSGAWEQLPILAPIYVALASLFGAFVFFVRRSLGGAGTRLSAVAVPMETRRLGDYISWPLEALVVAVIAGLWLAWLHGGVEVGEPILATYVVMGMLPAKILLVRNSFPLPIERIEEHQRYQEANRRFSLRIIELMRWSFLVEFAGPAAVHSLRDAHDVTWLRWLSGTTLVALVFLSMGLMIRGYSRLIAMGRDLRPIGSWSGPFRPGKLMLRGGITFGVSYCAGLVLLLILFRS